jgi:hypothetical protein
MDRPSGIRVYDVLPAVIRVRWVGRSPGRGHFVARSPPMRPCIDEDAGVIEALLR